jgi:hypothetical protein
LATPTLPQESRKVTTCIEMAWANLKRGYAITLIRVDLMEGVHQNDVRIIAIIIFFDANERRFIAKGNKPTLIRASSRARQQEQGGQSHDNYQLIERHEGGTKFHFTVRSNLLAIILRLVHLESKPERNNCKI